MGGSWTHNLRFTRQNSFHWATTQFCKYFKKDVRTGWPYFGTPCRPILIVWTSVKSRKQRMLFDMIVLVFCSRRSQVKLSSVLTMKFPICHLFWSVFTRKIVTFWPNLRSRIWSEIASYVYTGSPRGIKLLHRTKWPINKQCIHLIVLLWKAIWDDSSYAAAMFYWCLPPWLFPTVSKKS